MNAVRFCAQLNAALVCPVTTGRRGHTCQIESQREAFAWQTKVPAPASLCRCRCPDLGCKAIQGAQITQPASLLIPIKSYSTVA
jgi:hypothetical protein